MSSEKEMPRLPNNSQRITLLGRTGSGKTVAALWHLSMRDFEHMPWVIYDFKGDENLLKLDAVEVDLDFVPGKKDKGLFIVHPLPNQKEDVEKQMWNLWSRERVGVYVDEGYMVDNEAFDAILTQGRSKHIPVIVLFQRPVWMSRFALSETSFYQVFELNDKRDEATVKQFTPIDFDTRLPEYHSYYFDVARKRLCIFKPVPQESELVASINARLSRKRRRL